MILTLNQLQNFKRLERILSRGWAGREAGLEAGLKAGVEASLEASRHEASASVQGSKALRQASVTSLGTWLAGRTKAYK